MNTDYLKVKTLYDLYYYWKFEEIESLINSTILSNRLTSNKTDFIKCTDASETLYDKFASWCKEQINDFDYVVKYGDRKISRSVEKLLISYSIVNDIFPLEDNIDIVIDRIYDLICKKNIDNWLKKFDAYNLTSYQPLDNYNMEEVRTPNLTESISNTDSVSDTETGSNTKSVKTDITTTNDSESETGIFGFNSGSTSNPTADGTGSTTVHTTGSANDNTEQTNITGSHTGTKTQAGTKSNTGTETLTRSGNIGVTTSQQMLQSELDLRNQILIDEIYKALAKYMTNPVY